MREYPRQTPHPDLSSRHLAAVLNQFNPLDHITPHSGSCELSEGSLRIVTRGPFPSSMNPLAQYQHAMTIEEVLQASEVAWPLTRPMCSPIGDGPDVAIVCSEAFSRRVGAMGHSVDIAACLFASGEDRKEGKRTTLSRHANHAYDKACIGLQDISLAEVHDETAFGELYAGGAIGKSEAALSVTILKT